LRHLKAEGSELFEKQILTGFRHLEAQPKITPEPVARSVKRSCRNSGSCSKIIDVSVIDCFDRSAIGLRILALSFDLLISVVILLSFIQVITQ